MSIEDAKDWDFPPPNAGSLGKRIRNLAEQVDIDPDLMEVAFAQVVLGQMLPGVLRGGAALKIRIGPLGSRFSSDADLVLPHALVPDSFEHWINTGTKRWGQFRVSISRRKKEAQPAGVPPDYVIRTYTARIFYGDSVWRAVKLEVGRDEVGGFEQPSRTIAEEWTTYFSKIGLEDPEAVAVFPYPEQLVQKLDGCTRPDKHGDNDRAHDLVDIQLMLADTSIAPASLRDVARSTFAYRRVPWPRRRGGSRHGSPCMPPTPWTTRRSSRISTRPSPGSSTSSTRSADHAIATTANARRSSKMSAQAGSSRSRGQRRKPNNSNNSNNSNRTTRRDRRARTV